jgi:hypothetical protein
VTSIVGLDLEPRAMAFPPTGRHIHVARVVHAEDVARLLAPHRGSITCIGVSEKSSDAARLAPLAPGARILQLGNMQCPPLDGPVDLREML